MFKTKYRIIQKGFNHYQIEQRKWFFPFWRFVLCEYNPELVEKALAIIMNPVIWEGYSEDLNTGH